MRKHLRRWGAFWIVLTIWLVTWAGYAYMEVAHHGSQSDNPWVVWLTGTFENQQSEAWFGVVDTLLIVGLAHRLFQRAEDDTREIKQELQELRRLYETLVAVCQLCGGGVWPSGHTCPADPRGDADPEDHSRPVE